MSVIFGTNIFEWGEKSLSNNKEVLKLEKEHASLLGTFSTGIGIAFLIPGLTKIAENPLMATIGLILLIIGNLIFEAFYYPRYSLLIRKAKIKDF